MLLYASLPTCSNSTTDFRRRIHCTPYVHMSIENKCFVACVSLSLYLLGVQGLAKLISYFPLINSLWLWVNFHFYRVKLHSKVVKIYWHVVLLLLTFHDELVFTELYKKKSYECTRSIDSHDAVRFPFHLFTISITQNPIYTHERELDSSKKKCLCFIRK